MHDEGHRRAGGPRGRELRRSEEPEVRHPEDARVRRAPRGTCSRRRLRGADLRLQQRDREVHGGRPQRAGNLRARRRRASHRVRGGVCRRRPLNARSAPRVPTLIGWAENDGHLKTERRGDENTRWCEDRGALVRKENLTVSKKSGPYVSPSGYTIDV